MMKKRRKQLMHNYSQFIDKEIITKNGAKGLVADLTDERITIKFPTGQEMYKPDVAFKSSYIKFINESLNSQMVKIINNDDEEKIKHQAVIDKINKEAQKRNKRACEMYIELEKKDKALKRLFGRDFIYPPFEMFKKKFPYAKRKKTNVEKMIESIIAPVFEI